MTSGQEDYLVLRMWNPQSRKAQANMLSALIHEQGDKTWSETDRSWAA